MSSNLKVNTILPSTGTNVAIGTAGGSITMVGNVDIDINSGISTFNDIHISDKIVHDGDTNTAIRFPAADTITAETGGSERLRINSSGQLGIGITNPQGRLHISSGTSGDCQLIIESDTDNNNETDNPRILLRQDGGQDLNSIGLNFSASASTDNNSLYLASSGSQSGIIFLTGTSDGYTNATESVRISSSGAVSIASNNYGSGHADTKLRVGTESGSSQATAVIGSADQDVPALIITNWDGAATTNKNVIRFDNSGRGTYEIGGVGGTNAFAITLDTSEKMRIYADGRVRIGQNDSVFGQLSLNIPSQSGGSALQVMNTAAGSGDNTLTNIALRSVNNAGNQWAHAQYKASSHQFQFQGTTKVNINSNGLCFNSDTAATNALDDYEEGSWTPDVKGRTGGSFGIQVGQYTKIGRMVSCTCHINISSLTSSNGAFVVNGLPFTSANITNNYSVTSSVHFNNSFSIGGDRGLFNGLLAPNNNEVAFYFKSAAAITAVAASDFGSGNILFEITYKAI